MMKYTFLLFIVCAATTIAETRKISQAELKNNWPFTISSGEIECRTGQVLLFRDGARVYALNGTAKMRMPKLLDIEPIWKPDPKIPGAKINVGPLMDEARKLCK
jgi:hypothetical protein